MCQPKPGPRCTAHARANLQKVYDAIDQSQRILDEMSAHIEKWGVSDDRYARSSHNALVGKHERKLAALKKYLPEALANWHETPGGLKELNAGYREALANGDTATAEELKGAFERGKNARANAKFLLASKASQDKLRDEVGAAMKEMPSEYGEGIEHLEVGSPGAYRNVIMVQSAGAATQMRSLLDARKLQSVEVDVARKAYGPQGQESHDVWSEPDMLIREDMDAKEWGM